MLNDKVVIELTKDDAIIIFDWLARFNTGSCEKADEIEQQCLYNLEATFEEVLIEPFDVKYEEIITATKERIRRSMGASNVSADIELVESSHFIAQHPSSAHGYIHRADVFSQLGRNTERISDLSTAISLLSSKPMGSRLLCEVLYARGLTFQSMKEHRAALADFDAALKLDSDYPSVYFARAYSKIELGLFDRACADIEFASKLSPDDPNIESLRSRVRNATKIT